MFSNFQKVYLSTGIEGVNVFISADPNRKQLAVDIVSVKVTTQQHKKVGSDLYLVLLVHEQGKYSCERSTIYLISAQIRQLNATSVSKTIIGSFGQQEHE